MELIRSVLHYFFAFVCLVVGLYALSRTVKFASGMSRIWNFFTTSMTLLGFTLSLLMALSRKESGQCLFASSNHALLCGF